MKKLWKAAIMMFVMSCAACLCLGATAFAAEYKGEMEGGFTWEVDTKDKTLTIKGEGDFPIGLENDLPWRGKEDDIEHTKLIGGVTITSYSSIGTYFDSISQTISCNINDKFSWNFDKATKTLTFNGTGQFPKNFGWEFISDIDSIIIGDGITLFDTDLLVSTYVDNFVLGKNVQLSIPYGGNIAVSYTVIDGNPYYASYEGCLYNKDYTSLYYTPNGRESYTFHPNLKVLEEFSINTDGKSTIILPWGLTTINFQAFLNLGNNPVVLPDTIKSIDKSNGSAPRSVVNTFIYSNNNVVAKQVLKSTSTADHGGKRNVLVVDSVQEYYPDIKIDQPQPSKKTGWQTENGKKYYYNASGQRLIGWQQIDRAWYCFGNDGAMLTNQWMKWHNVWYFLRPSGLMSTNEWFRWNKCWYYTNSNGSMAASKWVLHKGKYYYLRSSGIMATNEWIKGRDGYWYYVDNDGVMMTNAWTPDGHYVNGSGVRTK